MSLPWLKNIAGLTLKESEYENIPRPQLELGIHVTTRTVCAGNLLGTLIGAISGLVRRFRGHKTILRSVTRGGLIGTAIGIPLGPLMTYGRIKNDPDTAVYDRCFRLRHNQSQIHWDRLAFGGVAIGVVARSLLVFVLALSTATLIALGVTVQLKSQKKEETVTTE